MGHSTHHNRSFRTNWKSQLVCLRNCYEWRAPFFFKSHKSTLGSSHWAIVSLVIILDYWGIVGLGCLIKSYIGLIFSEVQGFELPLLISESIILTTFVGGCPSSRTKLIKRLEAYELFLKDLWTKSSYASALLIPFDWTAGYSPNHLTVIFEKA